MNEALDELARLLPQLERLQRQREELRQATAREKSAGASRLVTQQRGEQLKAEAAALGPQLEQATRDREEADEEATRARTLQEQASVGLRELQLLRGSKLCRHCGQALTPGHIAEEKERRTAAVAAADERAHKTAAAQKAARGREADFAARAATVQKQLTEARVAWQQEKAEAE